MTQRARRWPVGWALMLTLVLVRGATAAAAGDAADERLTCMRDGDPAACRQALRHSGDDAELASAAGDVLMQARRSAEAIAAYRRAQRLGFADQESLTARIAGAEAQRVALRGICETRADETARRACDAALLPGAADETRILHRRAEINEVLHKPSEALDDMLAAQRFVPQDAGVAGAVLRLAQVSGREDNAALIGRGMALLALGRAADAVAPLRQALAHDPDSRPVLALLQSAQSREPVTLEYAQFSTPHERRFSNSAPASLSH